jgi:predicted amidohydrolase
MIVAGLQMDIVWEDPEANLRAADRLVGRAAADGSRLAVLPELFATGFSMASERLADHAGAILDGLGSLAERHGIWLAAGFAQRDGDTVYNCCSIVAPDGGERASYRKIHPFTLAGEPEHYGSGEEVTAIDIEGTRITPLICYDLRFTELFRATASATDLFLVLANWPDRRSHAWRILLQARAIDCQAWVLGVNRVGSDGNGVSHRGDTSLVDPMGEVVSSLAWEEGVVTGEVDVAAVAEVRRRYSFLADRRLEIYRRLDG